MFAVTHLTQKVQHAVCLMLSVVIVASALSLGAYGAQHAEHVGYSVTITQLQ